jgi:hypothetical protein
MGTNNTPARRQRHPRQPITRPGQNGFSHRQRFGLVIECDSEADQQRLYAKLQKAGYTPKVVCV